MKTSRIKHYSLLTVCLLSMAFACGQKKQTSDHGHAHESDNAHAHEAQSDQQLSFKDKTLAHAYEQYKLLRTALTATDFDKAKSNALILVTALKEVKNSDALLATATQISEAANIDEQRKLFSDLSNTMLETVQNNLESGKLYVAHCPMALNNTGASWLTEAKEIRNPYFGDKMMKCGSIKLTLN